ncbi:unnamed protein product [Caenorhabditis brenneri]
MPDFVNQQIITSLKTAQQGLDSLREEHSFLLTHLESNNNNTEEVEASLSKEKFIQVNDNLDKLMNGIDETSLMIMVTQIINSGDVQYSRVQENQRRLRQENAWLLDELSDTQKKLQESERTVGRLEEEVNHYKFLDSIKNLRCDNEVNSTAARNPQTTAVDTLQDLGFGPEEDDEINHNNNTHSSLMIQQPNPPVSGYEVPARIRTLHNLVVQYMKQGRYEVAVPLCKQAIEDLEKANGHNHPDVATMLNVLATVYRDQQKYKEAGQYLADALSIREKLFGENHPSVAATLNNLAIVFGKRGKYKDAEPLCTRALEIREFLLGKDHPDVAKQLNNLALVCQNLGKYEEVEALYKRSIEIYKKNMLDRADENAIKAENNLASVYLKQGKYEEAEELYKTILSSVHEKVLGNFSDQNKPIWQIAEEREERNRKGEMADSFESESETKFAKIESGVIISTLKNLGALYRKQGKYMAAETLEGLALCTVKQPDGLGDSSDPVISSIQDDSHNRVIAVQNGLKAKLMNVLGFSV